MPTRRQLIVGGAIATVTGLSTPAWAQARDPIAALLEGTDGRIGVAALNTNTGQRLMIDAEARYPLLSTFKLVLAAAVLARVERGQMALTDKVRFTAADLLEYAPVVRAAAATGELSVEALCAAAVEQSDNSAANLLLMKIGGPGGLTRFIRQSGDPATRLDRMEPELNRFAAGGELDTTIPYAMARLTKQLLTGGEVLSAASRQRLIGWMVASQTGLKRLRAGLPANWVVGDKTGTSGRGQWNDVAIATPPGRKPIIIASYLDAPGLDPAKADAVHVEVGKLIGAIWAR
ncbi:class A beta-lactamase [Sphingomonas sp. BGYR3]|uniref:class A beta-lactamase n=1 Tax=Sphingomonas sp. BGYR3 TaxID=2975483 RepID=UPI0021A293EF|nr:class A beta-lactamase [Sphingomonas sp. BGYR3]MDG5487563.1 class A beta-lactamase [Sphingomonas sp. BGYR3]